MAVLLGLGLSIPAGVGGVAGVKRTLVDPLWLRYPVIADAARRAEYTAVIASVRIVGARASSPTLQSAAAELGAGLSGLIGRHIPVKTAAAESVLGGCDGGSELIVNVTATAVALAELGAEGYAIERRSSPGRCEHLGTDSIEITATTGSGALHGSFALLGMLQRGQPLPAAGSEHRIVSVPRCVDAFPMSATVLRIAPAHRRGHAVIACTTRRERFHFVQDWPSRSLLSRPMPPRTLYLSSCLMGASAPGDDTADLTLLPDSTFGSGICGTLSMELSSADTPGGRCCGRWRPTATTPRRPADRCSCSPATALIRSSGGRAMRWRAATAGSRRRSSTGATASA